MSVSSILKRSFDIAASLTGLVFLWPLFFFLALLIRFHMGTPILFRQRRTGSKERPFTFVKFRTMTEQRDENGNLLPDEQRLTGLGRFLRATSLDELPQLWNVLQGDMSLVGPRPLLLEYVPRYNEFQRRRLEVKPGITGWAQIHGRNALSWEEKFELDVWYVDHWSLWLDIKILAFTVWKVLRGEGISQRGHATMPEFMGSHQSSRSQGT